MELVSQPPISLGQYSRHNMTPIPTVKSQVGQPVRPSNARTSSSGQNPTKHNLGGLAPMQIQGPSQSKFPIQRHPDTVAHNFLSRKQPFQEPPALGTSPLANVPTHNSAYDSIRHEQQLAQPPTSQTSSFQIPSSQTRNNQFSSQFGKLARKGITSNHHSTTQSQSAISLGLNPSLVFHEPKEAGEPAVIELDRESMTSRKKAPLDPSLIENHKSRRAPVPKPAKLQMAETRFFTNAVKRAALLDAYEQKRKLIEWQIHTATKSRLLEMKKHTGKGMIATGTVRTISNA